MSSCQCKKSHSYLHTCMHIGEKAFGDLRACPDPQAQEALPLSPSSKTKYE